MRIVGGLRSPSCRKELLFIVGNSPKRRVCCLLPGKTSCTRRDVLSCSLVCVLIISTVCGESKLAADLLIISTVCGEGTLAADLLGHSLNTAVLCSILPRTSVARSEGRNYVPVVKIRSGCMLVSYGPYLNAGVPGGWVGDPRAYQDQFIGLESPRVHTHS